jgi:hypothetical protein
MILTRAYCATMFSNLNIIKSHPLPPFECFRQSNIYVYGNRHLIMYIIPMQDVAVTSDGSLYFFFLFLPQRKSIRPSFTTSDPGVSIMRIYLLAAATLWPSSCVLHYPIKTTFERAQTAGDNNT